MRKVIFYFFCSLPSKCPGLQKGLFMWCLETFQLKDISQHVWHSGREDPFLSTKQGPAMAAKGGADMWLDKSCSALYSSTRSWSDPDHPHDQQDSAMLTFLSLRHWMTWETVSKHWSAEECGFLSGSTTPPPRLTPSRSNSSTMALEHSSTIFLCCLVGVWNISDDPFRNQKMNNKDHRVG